MDGNRIWLEFLRLLVAIVCAVCVCSQLAAIREELDYSNEKERRLIERTNHLLDEIAAHEETMEWCGQTRVIGRGGHLCEIRKELTQLRESVAAGKADATRVSSGGLRSVLKRD